MTPKRSGVWPALLCVASLSCWYPAAPQTATPSIHHVHGIVVDAVTGTPVARALVSSSDQKMAMLTSNEGKFEFDLQTPNGTAQLGTTSTRQGAVAFRQGPAVYLSVRKPGFRLMERPAVLPLGDASVLDAELRLKLTPESLLTGLVTNSSGEPPAGVIVQLYQKQVQDGYATWRVVQGQQTNPRGEFRFADLSAGDFKLMTQEWTDRGVTVPSTGKPGAGYPPVAFRNGTGLASAALISLGPGETVHADLHLRSAPYFPIDIPVTNYATGTGLNVTVEDAQGDATFSLAFNQQTHRVEGSLPNGVYRLTLTAYGEEQSTAATELTVAGPVHGRPITLAPATSIPVTVREEYTTKPAPETTSPGQATSNGQFIRRGNRLLQSSQSQRSVEVYLQPQSGEGSGAALSNQEPGQEPGNDRLVIGNVLPGTYRVQVTPHRGYVASVTANGTDLLTQPLVVPPGGGGATLEVTLRDDTTTLTGTIAPGTQGPGTPSPTSAGEGFLIWCFPLREQGLGQPVIAFAGPDGSFSTVLPPGRYLVLTGTNTSMRNLEYRNEAVARRLLATGTLLTLSPGQKLQTTLTPTAVPDLEQD